MKLSRVSSRSQKVCKFTLILVYLSQSDSAQVQPSPLQLLSPLSSPTIFKDIALKICCQDSRSSQREWPELLAEEWIKLPQLWDRKITHCLLILNLKLQPSQSRSQTKFASLLQTPAFRSKKCLPWEPDLIAEFARSD